MAPGGPGFAGRVVGRAVVRYDNMRRHDLAHFLHQAADVAGLVESRDDHGDEKGVVR